MWESFKRFAFRGNVIDLAIGVIIGAALGRIVNTLVDGVVMPPIGMLLSRVDFSDLLVALDPSKPVPKVTGRGQSEWRACARLRPADH